MAEYFQHERALVDKGATIGKGTRVWAHAHVMPGAVIGEDCNIGDFAFIENGAVLGNHVTVKNGVQVWDGVEAEDGVFLGPNAVFTNDLFPRSFIRQTRDQYLVKTKLRQGCTIGANATIVCGHTIGAYAFIAAGALVVKDVPDFALMVGVPAKRRAWICKCTKKLKFARGKAKCSCGAAYTFDARKKIVKPAGANV